MQKRATWITIAIMCFTFAVVLRRSWPEPTLIRSDDPKTWPPAFLVVGRDRLSDQHELVALSECSEEIRSLVATMDGLHERVDEEFKKSMPSVDILWNEENSRWSFAADTASLDQIENEVKSNHPELGADIAFAKRGVDLSLVESSEDEQVLQLTVHLGNVADRFTYTVVGHSKVIPLSWSVKWPQYLRAGLCAAIAGVIAYLLQVVLGKVKNRLRSTS